MAKEILCEFTSSDSEVSGCVQTLKYAGLINKAPCTDFYQLKQCDSYVSRWRNIYINTVCCVNKHRCVLESCSDPQRPVPVGAVGNSMFSVSCLYLGRRQQIQTAGSDLTAAVSASCWGSGFVASRRLQRSSQSLIRPDKESITEPSHSGKTSRNVQFVLRCVDNVNPA